MEDSGKNLSRLILARSYLTKLHKWFNCSGQDKRSWITWEGPKPIFEIQN